MSRVSFFCLNMSSRKVYTKVYNVQYVIVLHLKRLNGNIVIGRDAESGKQASGTVKNKIGLGLVV